LDTVEQHCWPIAAVLLSAFDYGICRVAVADAAHGAASKAEAGSVVNLSTFKDLLDRLMQQRTEIRGLLPAADVDIVRVKAVGLQQSLLPWPENRLGELTQLLPMLAAGECSPISRSICNTPQKCYRFFTVLCGKCLNF